MKYKNYSIEDFTRDEYFQKWVLSPDAMSTNFWEHWLADHPHKRVTIEKSKRLVLLMNADDTELSDRDFDAMWRNIIERRDDGVRHRIEDHKGNQPIFRKIAAVFVGLLATSLAVYMLVAPNDKHDLNILQETQITLELEDGTLEILDETSSKLVANTSGTIMVKQSHSTLQYKTIDSIPQVLAYNQLTVPYGKKFDLILSDGSRVFLNSGTKLRYPVFFLKDSPRNVYLDGEAYFSVETDKKRPFTVITDDMNTRVYGTEFNVSSYKNENNTSTVLVEGSVAVYKVHNELAKTLVVLSPGERAVFENEEIGVSLVNTTKYIAWKEGRLLFEDDPFYLIIKELERNFNVVIDNKFEALQHKKFTAAFQNESLEQILKICQEHTPFKYKVAGNKIIITELDQT